MNVIEEIINLKKQLQEGAGKVIGEVKEIACITVPDGWLPCDGSEYLKSDYPELYTAIGDLWGVNNPPSDVFHFRVPDRRGKVGVGLSTETEFNSIGKTGGEKDHTLTVGEMPSHTHGMGYRTIGQSGSNRFSMVGQTNANREGDVGTSSTGESKAHNNMPPYAVFNYIICAK